jgi:hypothetical protein
MNISWQELLKGSLISLAGLTVGTLLFVFVAKLALVGASAALAVLMPGTLLAVILGTVFNLNSILFALFYTMFVMQRRGPTTQDTLMWAGIWVVFGVLFGMLAGGFSLVGIVLMAVQGLAMSFGAHAALRTIKF